MCGEARKHKVAERTFEVVLADEGHDSYWYILLIILLVPSAIQPGIHVHVVFCCLRGACWFHMG